MALIWILVFPLMGFMINGAFQLSASRIKKSSPPIASGVIATMAMLLSFFVSALNAVRLFSLPRDGRLFEENVFSWIKVGFSEQSILSLDFSLRFDSLSAVFVLVITGVGALIHLYSIGYMKEDATPSRYFSYLNLFCFFMLILVLGSSLPLVFLGWEGVGLASYLLIGYWFDDFEKVKAGQKAFIMNRIGDLGFLLAMFVGFQYANTLDLLQLNQAQLAPAISTTFGLLIFFACTGKSAQIPLFTWLPDAMAGPTPVSALIHAATMVTSGVYLLTRLSGIISTSSITLSVIAMVGAVTAFVAATIACAQNDIKKILAYSTVSQLGFMFLACGVNAFDSAVFHVVTHAFFKALLFLGAGSVIHALHEEQNIFKMGNLRKTLPITSITFILGWAAIIGIPPFSGFFSKDEILVSALEGTGGNVLLFGMAIASTFLTAFYMTRLVVLVFFGKDRISKQKKAKIHESPVVMIFPLIALAVLSVVGGWFGSPYSLHEHHEHSTFSYIVMVGSVLLALASAFLAYKKYNNFSDEEQLNDFLANAWRIDRFYTNTVVGGVYRASDVISEWIEEGVIQRIVRWTGSVTHLCGTIIRSIQIGSIQAYLMMFALAITFLLFLLTYGVHQYGKL